MKIVSILLACAIATGSPAFSQDLKVPAPSPTTEIKQNFALSTVELSYSRPGVKDRKIFGELVPYGKVWRTGANGATTLTFGDEVSIGGTKIPAGKYGLLTIPDQNEWTIIISKQTDVTGSSAYKESEDVVRVKAKPEKLPVSIETFTIGFGDIKPASMNVEFLWESTYVAFEVKAEDVDKKVMTQIDELMKTAKPPYFSAAMYYLDNGKDLAKAQTWMDKAIQEDPKAFWIIHQKAKAQAKQGNKKKMQLLPQHNLWSWQKKREAKNMLK